MENVLISEEERQDKGISFYNTNRGGDITFHGPEQIVGYPILDLEKFYTDIGKYLRNLEEVIIATMADYGMKGERSPGETGVWLDASHSGQRTKDLRHGYSLQPVDHHAWFCLQCKYRSLLFRLYHSLRHTE